MTTSIDPVRAFDDAGLAVIRARLSALAARTIDGDIPRAAVLVPLCIRNGAPAILFTKRTETVGTHKGQVSFPGGRRDPGDRDVVDTALRELHEELGIARDTVLVLGSFHELMSITGLVVAPVIGFIGDRTSLTDLAPSPAEIDAVFSLTLDELQHHRAVRPLRSGRAGPWYTAGPHPVWGLTGFITDEVLRDLLGVPIPPLVLD